MRGGFAPGDVALVRSMRGDEVTAVRTGVPSNMGWAYSMRTRDGSTQTWHSDPDGASVIRPLVVIDYEDREQVERLVRAYIAQYTDTIKYEPNGKHRKATDDMQAGLRSLVAPAKPPEPQGLGAVVEDDAGDKWVRVETQEPDDPAWFFNAREMDASSCHYADITAVRVLSEGVRDE